MMGLFDWGAGPEDAPAFPAGGGDPYTNPEAPIAKPMGLGAAGDASTPPAGAPTTEKSWFAQAKDKAQANVQSMRDYLGIKPEDQKNIAAAGKEFGHAVSALGGNSPTGSQPPPFSHAGATPNPQASAARMASALHAMNPSGDPGAARGGAIRGANAMGRPATHSLTQIYPTGNASPFASA